MHETHWFCQLIFRKSRYEKSSPLRLDRINVTSSGWFREQSLDSILPVPVSEMESQQNNAEAAREKEHKRQ